MTRACWRTENHILIETHRNSASYRHCFERSTQINTVPSEQNHAMCIHINQPTARQCEHFPPENINLLSPNMSQPRFAPYQEGSQIVSMFTPGKWDSKRILRQSTCKKTNQNLSSQKFVLQKQNPRIQCFYLTIKIPKHGQNHFLS